MFITVKRKISNEKMWSCVCGLIEQPDEVVENDNENVNENENENANDNDNGNNNEIYNNLSNINGDLETQKEGEPKQFVVTGSCKAELKVSHISTDEDYNTTFPYEYSHSLPSLGIHYMCLSSDSKTIAAVSIDGTLHIIDVKNGMQRTNIGHNFVKNFFSAEFSGLSKASVFAGCGNGHVYKYDTITGELQQSLDTNRLQCIISLCVSPKSEYVACGDFDGYFTLFDAKKGKILNQTNYKKPIRKMKFDQHYRFIFAACDDRTLKIIEIPKGELVTKLCGHNTWVMSVDTSTNAHRFVTGGFDGAVKVWDIRFNKCTLTFLRNNNYSLWDVAFDKMDELVVSVADGNGLSVHYC